MEKSLKDVKKDWIEDYTEPTTGGFFRKGKHGFWYDVEGHRLPAPIFLQGEVLISLLGKKSKSSLSFRGQEIIVSPSYELIQVGKIVLDADLNLINYFGERITGLGSKNITFQDGKTIQEVHLGLDRKAFIDEKEKTPFLLNNENVTKHLQTVKKGGNRFEIFQTDKNQYVLSEKSVVPLTCDGHFVSIDFSTYVSINDVEVAQCQHDGDCKYMDIHSESTFQLEGFGDEPLTTISIASIALEDGQIRNMATTKKQFVYNETKRTIFSLNDGQLYPEAVEEVTHYEDHFGAITNGKTTKLFSKKTYKTLAIGTKTIEIRKILSLPDQPLLNAIDAAGNKIVIDARKGFDQLEIAQIGDQEVVKVLGKPEKIGNTFLQNALLKTLGGTEKRVLDLSKEILSIYTLPTDLKAYPENQDYSVYNGHPILELDFEHIITIEGEEFLLGKFIPYREDISSIVIQKKNNRPLHLEGGAHRNELVTGFNFSTLQKKYYLGHHRMVGVYTLKEDYKPEELLFSFHEKKSWLKFNDDYLPIFRKIIKLKNARNWDYLLFELRGLFNSTEFVAVEGIEPHRILVEKNRGKISPKVFNSKDRLPKTPEEVSLLRKLIFEDPGYLIEI